MHTTKKKREKRKKKRRREKHKRSPKVDEDNPDGFVLHYSKDVALVSRPS